MRRIVIAAVSLSAITAAIAAGADSVDRVAQGLRDRTVYVDRAARPTLTAAQAASLRARIARRQPGRIRIAVVPAALAARAGNVGALTNEIDGRLHAPGTLIVVAGPDVHLVVSYDDVAGALRAVRNAFVAHRPEGLARRLAAAVDGIARVDPEPVARRGAPAAGFDPSRLHLPDPARTVKHVVDTFRIVAIVVALAFAVPILLVTLAIVRRIRRRPDPSFAMTPTVGPPPPDPAAPAPVPVATDSAGLGQDEANRALGRPDD